MTNQNNICYLKNQNVFRSDIVGVGKRVDLVKMSVTNLSLNII